MGRPIVLVALLYRTHAFPGIDEKPRAPCAAKAVTALKKAMLQRSTKVRRLVGRCMTGLLENPRRILPNPVRLPDPSPFFGGADFLLVHPEVVGQLVPQCVIDHLRHILA